MKSIGWIAAAILATAACRGGSRDSSGEYGGASYADPMCMAPLVPSQPVMTVNCWYQSKARADGEWESYCFSAKGFYLRCLGPCKVKSGQLIKDAPNKPQCMTGDPYVSGCVAEQPNAMETDAGVGGIVETWAYNDPMGMEKCEEARAELDCEDEYGTVQEACDELETEPVQIDGDMGVCCVDPGGE
jgi:hypothetical protein